MENFERKKYANRYTVELGGYQFGLIVGQSDTYEVGVVVHDGKKEHVVAAIVPDRAEVVPVFNDIFDIGEPED